MRALWLYTLTLIGCACTPSEDLEFSESRVRALIPGQTTTVAYTTITNNTPVAITLVTAEADLVRKIDFHTHSHDGNLVKMRQIPNLLIPANDSIILITGGTHLMLSGVSDLPEQLELRFASQSGQNYSVPFDVIPLSSR